MSASQDEMAPAGSTVPQSPTLFPQQVNVMTERHLLSYATFQNGRILVMHTLAQQVALGHYINLLRK